jgi:hypothetical protein
MGRPVKEGLRSFTRPEEQELQRVVKATSERVDSVRRAKALLAVATGKSRTAAGQEAGLSREGVTQVGKRVQPARTGHLVDCDGTGAQADLYEQAAGAHREGTAA